MSPFRVLTHWGRVTHIFVSTLTTIGSDNGLSPGWHQAIIWTNAGILWIGPLGTNFSEILIKIYTFSFKKMHLKMSSGKWRPFCLSLNVLMGYDTVCGDFWIPGVYLMLLAIHTKYFPMPIRFASVALEQPWTAKKDMVLLLVPKCKWNITKGYFF